LDLVTYLYNLNGISYGSSTSPVITSVNTIQNVISPGNGQAYYLGSDTNKYVPFNFNYSIADYTYDYASIELANVTTGFTYSTYQKPVTASGVSNYSYALDLPAGQYFWRPYLYDQTTGGKIYHPLASSTYFAFQIIGTSPAIRWDENATSSTFDPINYSFGTSTITIGTTTYDWSDVNLDFMDTLQATGTCGVNMSCAIQMCLDFPSICERWPFAYAVDIISIMNNWSDVLNSGTLIDTITYELDLGVSTGSITMLDLRDGTLGKQLADKTRYWSSLLVWLVFGFWSLTFAGKLLT